MPQKSHAKPAWEDVNITHHEPLPPQLNKNQQQQQWHHNHYRKQREWQPQGIFFSFLFSCSTNHYSLDYATYYAYRTTTTPHLLPGLCSYLSYQGHQASKGGTSVEVLPVLVNSIVLLMFTRAALPLMVLLAWAAAQATDYSMGCFTAIVQYRYIWQAYSFVIDSLRLTQNGMALRFLVTSYS